MKKLIAGESRKDIDRARKRMTGCRIAVGLPGILAGDFLASEVLTRGFQLLSQSQPRPALSLADLLLEHVDDLGTARRAGKLLRTPSRVQKTRFDTILSVEYTF